MVRKVVGTEVLMIDPLSLCPREKFLADLIGFIQLLKDAPNGASLSSQDSPSTPPVRLQGGSSHLTRWMPSPPATKLSRHCASCIVVCLPHGRWC